MPVLDGGAVAVQHAGSVGIGLLNLKLMPHGFESTSGTVGETGTGVLTSYSTVL